MTKTQGFVSLVEALNILEAINKASKSKNPAAQAAGEKARLGVARSS